MVLLFIINQTLFIGLRRKIRLERRMLRCTPTLPPPPKERRDGRRRRLPRRDWHLPEAPDERVKALALHPS